MKKELFILLTIAGITVSSDAQLDNYIGNSFTVNPSDTSGGIKLRLDGIVIAKSGTEAAATLLSEDQGAGNRMLWHPGKRAFRAGGVSGSGRWDESMIGLYSFAVGYETLASGEYTFAAGSNARALGNNSIAMGLNLQSESGGIALGSNGSSYLNSIAMGSGASANYQSIALGYSPVATYQSTAIGTSVTASYYSTALGYMNSATGSYSTVLGYMNTANGFSSTALGYATLATGMYATSLGYGTTARSYAVTAIGRYNADTGSTSSWVATDPLFIVGNGNNPYQPSNAFTVFKNATAQLGGYPVLTSSSMGTLPSTGPQLLGISASASGQGQNLTIHAGAAASGSPNQPGGSLILSGGASTGTGGSAIEFRTAASGSPNPTTRLRINTAGGIEAGQGLTAAGAPQFVVGKYNDISGTHGQGVFIIGAGTAATPKNAMRVLDDGSGTILIRQQGDLPMGDFNQGEQP